MTRAKGSSGDRDMRIEACKTCIHAAAKLSAICMYCGRIRETPRVWKRLNRPDKADNRRLFSHSVCPTCYGSALNRIADEVDTLERDLGHARTA